MYFDTLLSFFIEREKRGEEREREMETERGRERKRVRENVFMYRLCIFPFFLFLN